MVPEESYESRYQITKMRTAVFLLIFCEQVRGPQSRFIEFAVSYDPDSEQVGESRPWTLTGKTDSGMVTHKNYLRERSAVTDMPNNTAAYENPWPGGQWRVLNLACHQAIQATANKRYNTTFLPRNDRPNPSYFSNSTGITLPWNAAHRVGVVCIVFHYGFFCVSCILYPAPAREHVPYIKLHATQAWAANILPRGKNYAALCITKSHCSVQNTMRVYPVLTVFKPHFETYFLQDTFEYYLLICLQSVAGLPRAFERKLTLSPVNGSRIWISNWYGFGSLDLCMLCCRRLGGHASSVFRFSIRLSTQTVYKMRSCIIILLIWPWGWKHVHPKRWQHTTPQKRD